MPRLGAETRRFAIALGGAIVLHAALFRAFDFSPPEYASSDARSVLVQLETRTVESGEPRSQEPEHGRTPEPPTAPTREPEKPPAPKQPPEEDGAPAPKQPPAPEQPLPEDSSPAPEQPPPEDSPPAHIPDIPRVEAPHRGESSPEPATPDVEQDERPEETPETSTHRAGDALETIRGDPPTDHPGAPRSGVPGDSAPTAPRIQPARYVEPRYPDLARRRHVEGTVVVELEIGRRGRVRDVHLRSSSGSDILDREALRTARLWRFAREHAGETSVHRIVFALE